MLGEEYMTDFERNMAALNRLKARGGYITQIHIDTAYHILSAYQVFLADKSNTDWENSDGPEASAFSCLQPGLKDVVRAVVLMGMPLEAVEKEQKWPSRSAKILLRYGLEAFAEIVIDHEVSA